MNYSVSEQNDVIIIALSGKIMGGPEAAEINDKINQLIDERSLKVVIDLLNVEWMNSSGLGILISAVTLLKKNGGGLRLINVSDRIQNLLKITKLSGVFETCTSLEEAVGSLR
ncbi:MAG: anti-sigma factor antagonist [Calditrichales bacterium]|nr:MAG: anti-sigma factor antagonist [Calditrichales bacterium]